jgi:hypothetical protein
MKRLILAAIAILLVSLSSLSISGQQTLGQGTDETTIVPVEESTDDGEVSTAGSAIVWSCVGHTHRPHASTHFPGRVNVESAIDSCTTFSSLYTAVTLYRNGEEVDYESAYRDGYSVNAFANVPCTGNADYYYARSFHQVVVGDSGGTGTSSNAATVPVC